MCKIHSVTGRIIIGITIGAITGGLAITILPLFGFSLLSTFGFGTLMVFILMGLSLGLVGIFDHHPIFGFQMRWWIRGSVMGFLFMLMYILLAFDSLSIIMQSSLLSWMGLQSPFWVLCDGVTIGLLMGFMETRFAGEGSKLPLQ